MMIQIEQICFSNTYRLLARYIHNLISTDRKLEGAFNDIEIKYTILFQIKLAMFEFMTI